MTTALLSPQNPKFMLLLLLGVGAFMVTRRANAGTVQRSSSASTPQGAAQRFSYSPGTALAGGPARVSSNASASNLGAIATIAQAGSQLLGKMFDNRTTYDLGGASGNEGMSTASQYAAYGAGRSIDNGTVYDLGGASGNEGMSIADQYAAYGQGQTFQNGAYFDGSGAMSVADQYAAYGQGRDFLFQ